jgi:hypothetical protein
MGWLLRLGVNRGFIGGNRFFTAIGTVAIVFRVLQKLAGTGPKTLYTHEVKQGEVVIITDGDHSNSSQKGRKGLKIIRH